MTVAVASPTLPRKLSSVKENVKSTPTANTVAFNSTRREPSNGESDAATTESASTLIAPVLAGVETVQKADNVRDAALEDVRPSRRRLPHNPMVCSSPRWVTARRGEGEDEDEIGSALMLESCVRRP